MTSFLAAMILLGPATEPEPKFTMEAQKEIKKLEGKWRVQKMAGKGMEIVVGPNDKELIVEFTGRKWLLGTAAKRVEKAEIVALDPTTDPKCIDLKSLEKADDGGVDEAIYQLDGDTLIICLYQGKGKQRPTSFENPKDQDTVMVVMKRVKE